MRADSYTCVSVYINVRVCLCIVVVVVYWWWLCLVPQSTIRPDTRFLWDIIDRSDNVLCLTEPPSKAGVTHLQHELPEHHEMQCFDQGHKVLSAPGIETTILEL